MLGHFNRISIGLFLLTVPATAGVVQRHASVDFQAGAYCRVDPDDVKPAPKTNSGTVELLDNAYRFALEGDEIRAFDDIGIGVIVRLSDYRPGEEIELTIRFPDKNLPDVWETTVNDDGTFWFGHAPEPETQLPIGRYQFIAKRNSTVLLDYEFNLWPPRLDEVDDSPCFALVS